MRTLDQYYLLALDGMSLSISLLTAEGRLTSDFDRAVRYFTRADAEKAARAFRRREKLPVQLLRVRFHVP